jgi:hypothetical protein
VNVPPNVELRTARLAQQSPRFEGEPMSRSELAEAVNAELWRSTRKRFALDAHAIARYERGAVRWPSAAYRSALRTVLGVATDAEIGFHPIRRRGAPADPVGPAWPASERESYRGVTGLAVGIAELDACPDEYGPHDHGPHAYGRALARLQALDRARGARAALGGVLELVERIDRELRAARAADRVCLLGVGARAAEFAGFLCRDLGATVRCLRCHDRAMEWAQQGQDAPMQAYVLLRKAQAAYDDRDAARMLALTRAARAFESVVVPGLRAEILQQQARAEAMLGAPDGEVLCKLDQARSLLAPPGSSPPGSAPPGDEPGADYTATLLDLQTGICLTELGHPREAVRWYRSGLAELDGSARDSAYFQMLLAGALALSGEPDEAVAIGLRALPVAVGVTSRRTVREARALSVALRPWARRAPVRELYDRLAGAARALSAG